MEVIIRGEAKEIAALVLPIQERRDTDGTINDSERESLIRQYEKRLKKLKAGASPTNVIL